MEKTTRWSQKKKIVLACAALVLLIAAFLLAYTLLRPQTAEGQKAIDVVITHGDGSVKNLTLETQAEYLRGALEEQALIAGEEGEFGLYVLTVDGETADESAQQWWCFTKGGETLNTGVDTTPIADGEAFEITLTTGW